MRKEHHAAELRIGQDVGTTSTVIAFVEVEAG
jgi:hypothetical protein